MSDPTDGIGVVRSGHRALLGRRPRGGRDGGGRLRVGRDVDELAAELVARVLERHPATGWPARSAVCSVLVGDRPVRSQDPESVVVRPGEVVELLPPFAGG